MRFGCHRGPDIEMRLKQKTIIYVRPRLTVCSSEAVSVCFFPISTRKRFIPLVLRFGGSLFIILFSIHFQIEMVEFQFLIFFF